MTARRAGSTPGAVVVAAGTLNTPQLLLRSGLPDSPSSRLVGRNLGFHPVRLVYGLFDEPQDAHMVYPITRARDGAPARRGRRLRDRGDDDPGPGRRSPRPSRTRTARSGGAPLVEAVRGFRRWVGVLAMVNDENNGVVRLDENGQELFDAPFTPTERERMAGALDFSREVLSRRAPRGCSGPGSPRRTCRARAAWAATRSARSSTPTAQSWDVKRLYVGDGSVVPRTLSVNPSLTIMALASRLAEHLHADPHGYLS